MYFLICQLLKENAGFFGIAFFLWWADSIVVVIEHFINIHQGYYFSCYIGGNSYNAFQRTVHPHDGTMEQPCLVVSGTGEGRPCSTRFPNSLTVATVMFVGVIVVVVGGFILFCFNIYVFWQDLFFFLQADRWTVL